MELSVDFLEAIKGTNRVIQYKRSLLCQNCKGKKVKEIHESVECPKCYGTGDKSNTLEDVCASCMGTGLQSVMCQPCSG